MNRWTARFLRALVVLTWATTITQIALIGQYSVKQFACELTLTAFAFYLARKLGDSPSQSCR